MGLINPDLTGNMYGKDLKPVVEAILREFNGNISNENISDDLKLGYGQIASWNITNNYIYPDPDSPDTPSIQTTSNTVGDGSATSAGVTFNDAGIYACEASQLLADANVRILTDGTAFFSGEITAGSGSIGGWTIGATALTAGSGATTVGLDSAGTNPAIYAGSATPGSAPFRVTQAGALTATSATITGTITATSGVIGGFTVDETEGLYAGTGATRVQMKSGAGIWAGATAIGDAPFSVTNAGVLTAESGTIGGFTLGASEMYGGIIKTAATVGAGSTGVIMDTDGLRGYDSVLGNTFELPTDGGAPTFSSGVINETVYEISTNAILRTSSTVGDGSASSAGVLINNTGFYACEASQLAANANVKILVDGSATFKGTVTATSGTFTGITAAQISVGNTGYIVGGGLTGYDNTIAYDDTSTDYDDSDVNYGGSEVKGFFLGYDTDDYKILIGDPGAGRLAWDGSNLIIVPGAGSSIDGGYIKNQTIDTAQIANAAITSAKIDSLTADLITAGRLQSSDGNTYFDLDNDRIVVNDGTHDRIIIGNLS